MLQYAGIWFGSSSCKWKCQGAADGIKLSYWSKDTDGAQEAVERLQLLHSHRIIEFDTKQPNFLLDMGLSLNFASSVFLLLVACRMPMRAHEGEGQSDKEDVSGMARLQWTTRGG
jgi:hypothetical protein